MISDSVDVSMLLFGYGVHDAANESLIARPLISKYLSKYIESNRTVSKTI